MAITILVIMALMDPTGTAGIKIMCLLPLSEGQEFPGGTHGT
jgi:hypothetical protein